MVQLFTNEEISRVCILGPGGMGKTSVLLTVVELSLVKERFPGGIAFGCRVLEPHRRAHSLRFSTYTCRYPEANRSRLTRSSLNSTPRRSLASSTISRHPGMHLARHKIRSTISCRLAMLSHVDLCHDAWNVPAVRCYQMANEGDPMNELAAGFSMTSIPV